MLEIVHMLSVLLVQGITGKVARVTSPLSIGSLTPLQNR